MCIKYNKMNYTPIVLKLNYFRLNCNALKCQNVWKLSTKLTLNGVFPLLKNKNIGFFYWNLLLLRKLFNDCGHWPTWFSFFVTAGDSFLWFMIIHFLLWRHTAMFYTTRDEKVISILGKRMKNRFLSKMKSFDAVCSTQFIVPLQLK